jgi:hypothetical protein
MSDVQSAFFARTLLRIAAAALWVGLGWGCVHTHVSSDDRETIKQIAVKHDETTVKIAAASSTNLFSGAAVGTVSGFAGGALSGAAALSWGGLAGVAAGAAVGVAVGVPAGLWHGAACGLAMGKAEIEDPTAAFKQLYEKNVLPDSFRHAVVDRLTILLGMPSVTDSSSADAVVEILQLSISLGGSFATCEPTLSGFVEWRVTRSANDTTMARNRTSLRQPMTAKTFKDVYAAESAAGPEIQTFVNALGAAVANDALGKK